MNPREFKKLTELLKRLREIKRMTDTLKQIKNLRQMRDHPEMREWLEKNHDFFQGLNPQDWAWLKEKTDYDEAAWKAMVKALEGDPKP